MGPRPEELAAVLEDAQRDTAEARSGYATGH